MRYDVNGNITKMKVNTTTKTYAYYTNANKVQNVDRSGNDYVYDPIGNITQSIPKSINTLTYDPFVNRTKTISMSSGNSMNMSYDGTERRVYRKDIVSGVTTEVLYLHDGMNAIVEKDKNGNSTEYVYGPTGIIFIKTATQTNFVLKDHLGSIRATINTAELPYAAVGYDYSAFGTILSTVSNSGYFYTGQEYDKTSGLHNFKARMYDSDLAMFYGVDAAGQYASPFAFVGNNPITRRDPSGNFSFDLKNLIPGYSVYSLGRNIVRAYNNAGGGLHGIGEAFSVVNRTIISVGASVAVGGVTGNVLAGAGIAEGGFLNMAGSGAAGGAAGSAAGGGNIGDGAISGAIGGAIGYGANQILNFVQHRNPNEFMSQTTTNGNSETNPSELELHEYAEKKFGAKEGEFAVNRLYLASESQVPPGWRYTESSLLGNQPNWFKRFLFGEITALGVTRPSSISGLADIWIAPAAFASPEQLYYTVGHELIHAYHIHINNGLLDVYKSEHAAYLWMYQKAIFYRDMDIAREAFQSWQYYKSYSGYPYPGSSSWSAPWHGF